MTAPETKEKTVEEQAALGLRPTPACGPRPSPWIVRFAHLVPAGAPVLDVACGQGRHSLYFLGRGHPVTAVDIDVGGMGALSGRAGLELVQADLEAPGSAWPFGGRQFGAVVVVNYLWRPLFPALIAAVAPGGAAALGGMSGAPSVEAAGPIDSARSARGAPGGVLLYDTFGVGQERYGRPRNPDHLLRPGELLEAVRGKLEVRAYECGEVGEPIAAVRQSLCAARVHKP